MFLKIHDPAYTKDKRRVLRKESTPQEQRLWSRLRNSQLGHKFKRQHGIGHYIADFYCARKKLVIEIDGSHHYEPEEMEYDRERTIFLQYEGCIVLRFSNADINTNLKGVLMKIQEVLQ